MATFWYDKYVARIFAGQMNWASGTFVFVGAGSGYTPDKAAHEFLSDVASGERIWTSSALGSKSVSQGYLLAGNTTINAVTGSPTRYLLLVESTGDPATSRLMALIDTDKCPNLPLTHNGGNVNVKLPALGFYGV